MTAVSTDSQERAGYLHEVCALLWPAPAEVTAARKGAGSQPELIVLPGMARPRLLVPSGRRTSAAAVRGYGEPGSAKSRLAAKVLAAALASGAGGLVLRDRLAIHVPAGAETIESYLGDVLRQPVRVATHLGTARANRKPVLQVLTPGGDTVGYAKIGVNELTASLVAAERAALTKLAGLTAITVPEVLAAGRWRDLEVLVLSPLPVWQKRVPLRPGQLAAAMAELAGPAGAALPLAESPYWRRLEARVEAAGDSTQLTGLRTALGALADRAGGTALRYGAWHGDWTPWNMANTPSGLLVWDWERFTTGVPVGFDPLHYWLQTQVVPGKRDPAQAAAECVRLAPELLDGMTGQARLTALLYLADLSVRYLADRQEQAGARLGDPGRWLIPVLTAGVAELER
jgi:hypothetical protein